MCRRYEENLILQFYVKNELFIAAFLKFFLRIKENFFKGNLEGTLLKLSI